MRVFHAADERTPKTEDSLAEDAVWSEPVSDSGFPVTGQILGNGSFSAVVGRKKACWNTAY
jgi:hypothetical protein